ncbi:hypothetical protein BC827DRAFT_1235623 [Russula dissimulans]|nr:hypothetical protein BC827DRAFT_1235623 [Russula dissimulans]
MPQLETLGIDFPVPTRSSSPQLDVEEQLLRRPIKKHVKLPNLRWFKFQGESAYLEALLPHFTTPRLKKLNIAIWGSPLVFVPHLIQFMNTTKNLKRSHRADLLFLDAGVYLELYRHARAGMHALRLSLLCLQLPEPTVASVAQISNVLGPVFSHVIDLRLCAVSGSLPPEWHDEDDYLRWRDVLRSFSNAQSLLVHRDLVGAISRSLQFDDEESPVVLLPELNHLYCRSDDSDTVDASFAPFIDARKNADRPVTLTVIPIPPDDQ